MRTITFNELRKIKDSLPSGSMHRIADELGLHVDTVRNFFGGHNFKEGKSVGIHLEPGPDGGLVMAMILSFRQNIQSSSKHSPKSTMTPIS